MSGLEALQARVRSLESERDLARAAVEEARRELENERAKTHAEVIALARKRNVRRRRIAIGTLLSVAVSGLVTAAVLTHVEEEMFEAEVTRVRGPAPAEVGERCRVALGPAYGPANADLRIDCGGQRLYGYGAFGAVRCETEDGRATLCTDQWSIPEDGDPSVRLDTRARTLEIHDGLQWRIWLALDE
jgi:hypothetical protein